MPPRTGARAGGGAAPWWRSRPWSSCSSPARWRAWRRPTPTSPRSVPVRRRCSTRRRSRCGSTSPRVSTCTSAGSSSTTATATGYPRGRYASPHPNGSCSRSTASSPDGSYIVTWRAVSEDSHPLQGTWTFHVGSASASVVGHRSGRGRPARRSKGRPRGRPRLGHRALGGLRVPDPPRGRGRVRCRDLAPGPRRAGDAAHRDRGLDRSHRVHRGRRTAVRRVLTGREPRRCARSGDPARHPRHPVRQGLARATGAPRDRLRGAARALRRAALRRRPGCRSGGSRSRPSWGWGW